LPPAVIARARLGRIRGTLDDAQLADARSAPARSFSALDLLGLFVVPVFRAGGAIGWAVARHPLSRAKAPERIA